MRDWFYALRGYGDRRVLSLLFLGISSGLPFMLVLSTLSMWLIEAGISKTTIGQFVFVSIPYSLKFLWAGILDKKQIPFLGPKLGQRRSWLLISQLTLIIGLIGLGAADPTRYIYLTAFFSVIVSFASASQDVIIQAYRIEILEGHHHGPGAGMLEFGWRLGMLASGAGALYLAMMMSWFSVYLIMAGCILVIGIGATLINPEPQSHMKSLLVLSPDVKGASKSPEISFLKDKDRAVFENLGEKFIKSSVGENFKSILLSLREFTQRQGWVAILAFIFFYKLGDTILIVMSPPFLTEIGFSKLEIANVAKLFGISAMTVGGLAGGVLIARLGIFQTLLICSSFKVLVSAMFAIQAMVGHKIGFLMITMGLENFTCGIDSAALIAYLSTLCTHGSTGAEYALLASFGSLSRIIISAVGGWLADHMNWTSFFILTAVACTPGVIILLLRVSLFSQVPLKVEKSAS